MDLFTVQAVMPTDRMIKFSLLYKQKPQAAKGDIKEQTFMYSFWLQVIKQDFFFQI